MTPDDWSVEQGRGSATIWTYFKYSEDQTCVLSLYRRIYAQYDRSKEATIKDNLLDLKQPGRWKVGSGQLHKDRIGLVKFTNMPLQAFSILWRQPIDPKSAEFALIRDDTMSSFPSGRKNIQRVAHHFPFSYREHYKLGVFAVWPGIFEFVPADDHGGLRVSIRSVARVREDFRHWLQNETKGLIYPFADCPSTFTTEEDEWIYLTDYGLDTT